LAVVQARRFSLFGHIARMPDETDAKKILTAAPFENWRRPSGRPRTIWMKTPSRHEILKPLPGRSKRCGSESSTLETDAYVRCYALLVVHATKEEEVCSQVLDISN